MRKMITRFFKNEDGAVLLNWGVLVCSFMLLAAVALGTLQDSVKPLSASASISLAHMR